MCSNFEIVSVISFVVMFLLIEHLIQGHTFFFHLLYLKNIFYKTKMLTFLFLHFFLFLVIARNAKIVSFPPREDTHRNKNKCANSPSPPLAFRFRSLLAVPKSAPPLSLVFDINFQLSYSCFSPLYVLFIIVSYWRTVKY